MKKAMVAVWAVCLGMVCGCGDPMNGPERVSWDGVQGLRADVERGEVWVYGSRVTGGLQMDRWRTGESTFRVFREENNGGWAELEARCEEGESCEVRYEISVESQIPVSVDVEEGEIQLFQLAGDLRVRMGDGEVRAQRLRTERLEVHLQGGRARLDFEEPPLFLDLKVDDGEVLLLLPAQRYRCDFDQEGENLRLNELHCHGLVDHVIQIEPAEATVRFEFHEK